MESGWGIYTTYDPDKKPGAPNFIHAGDTPREQSTQSASDRAMNESLHSTDKPKDIDYGGEAIQSASVPNASGASVVTNANGTNTSPCDYDADGRPTCTVQSERSMDSEVPGFVGSNIGTQIQTTKYEPLPNVENLKKAVVNLQDLKSGECRTFLNAVLRNMKIERKINKKKTKIDTAEKLFDYITGTKNIGFVAEEVKQTTFFVGQKAEPVSGLSDGGDGDITLRRTPKAGDAKTKYLYQMNRVHIIIHEMFHRVDKGHEAMRKAGYDALSPAERKNFKLSGDDSSDFTRMMNQKCGFNPDDSDEVKANLVQ